MIAIAIDQLRGARVARRREREIRRSVFRPKPTLTGSQWADKHGRLPASTSAEPGRWYTNRAEYQRAILDEITSPLSKRVCWVAPAQSGKTACVLKGISYYIDQDPASMLIVQPSLEFARDFSKDRLKSEIQATPRLRSRVKESRGRRDATETILRKEYPGGYLTLVGANSATGLSSRPIRIVFFDEIDKYPPSAGDKGDPIALGTNRTRTFFWNKKIVLVSTPSIRGVSRIEKEWNESDQRRFFVPCPHCDHFQILEWKNVDFDTKMYRCADCAALIYHASKGAMLLRGEWRVTRPEGSFPGFHLNALYSPWTTWAEMVEKFLVAKKDRQMLKAFINEELAEWWDEDGEALDADSLKSRRETYGAEVPIGAGLLTAFIDAQRDWLEIAVKGYGASQESWLVAHYRIRGDTKLDDVWMRADHHLTRAYRHESGATMHIAIAGVDSGDGDNVTPVYRFVAPRQRRAICPVRATKGSSQRGRPIIAQRPSKKNKYGVRVHHVGTDTAKDVIFPRLRLQRASTGECPPGYMHFPQRFPDGGADDEYLDQFGREKIQVKHSHGVPFRVYEVVPAGARNEAIDLEVGCLRMLHELGAGVYDNLSVAVLRVNENGARLRALQPVDASATTPPVVESPDAPTSPPVPTSRPQPPRQPPRGGGYINAWKRR